MDSPLVPGGFALVGILIWLAGIALSLLITYWLIRMAVKHGTISAHEELDRRARLREASRPAETPPRLRDVDPRWR